MSPVSLISIAYDEKHSLTCYIEWFATRGKLEVKKRWRVRQVDSLDDPELSTSHTRLFLGAFTEEPSITFWQVIQETDACSPVCHAYNMSERILEVLTLRLARFHAGPQGIMR